MTVLLQALALYAGTFVLEDGTTIAGGLMIHEGRIPFLVAFVALSFGMFVARKARGRFARPKSDDTPDEIGPIHSPV